MVSSINEHYMLIFCKITKTQRLVDSTTQRNLSSTLQKYEYFLRSEIFVYFIPIE